MLFFDEIVIGVEMGGILIEKLFMKWGLKADFLI